MSQPILSFEQSPPLSVPGPYFVAAPLFALAAGVVLFLDPLLFVSRWLPGTLVLTHLLTLGFLGAVMFGAFQQLLPVLAGSPVPRAELTAPVIFVALTCGTLALAVGLATGMPLLLRFALVLLGIAFTLFLLLAGWALLRSPSRHPTVRAMAGALVALAVTAALGLMLAAGHAGLAPLLRQYTDTHAAIGAVGWIALLVAGVAWQVVPMFQLTPDYPRWLVRLFLPGTVGALVLIFFGAGVPWATPAALLLAAFGVVTLDLQRRRRRRLPDVTVGFWQMGMVSLLTALLIWPGAALFGYEAPPVAIGVLYLVGFAMSVVNGMLYKIVPFLVWLHLNNLSFSSGQRFDVPTMKQVIPEARARRQLLASRLALLLMGTAAAFPLEPLVRTAGLAFTISNALLAANLWSALALHRRLRRECLAQTEAAGGSDGG